MAGVAGRRESRGYFRSNNAKTTGLGPSESLIIYRVAPCQRHGGYDDAAGSTTHLFVRDHH
jgi:hypothetical protein